MYNVHTVSPIVSDGYCMTHMPSQFLSSNSSTVPWTLASSLNSQRRYSHSLWIGTYSTYCIVHPIVLESMKNYWPVQVSLFQKPRLWARTEDWRLPWIATYATEMYSALVTSHRTVRYNGTGSTTSTTYRTFISSEHSKLSSLTVCRHNLWWQRSDPVRTLKSKPQLSTKQNSHENLIHVISAKDLNEIWQLIAYYEYYKISCHDETLQHWTRKFRWLYKPSI